MGTCICSTRVVVLKFTLGKLYVIDCMCKCAERARSDLIEATTLSLFCSNQPREKCTP